MFVPRKVTFYNKDKEKYKVLLNKKVVRKEGMYVTMLSEMKNLKMNGYTVLNVKKMDVGLEISDHLVGMKGLKTK